MNGKMLNNITADENEINEINIVDSNKEKDNTAKTEKKSDKYACQKRWQEKAGYTSKTYKLKKEIVDGFADACRKNGISQASQLSILMQEFIDQMSK